LTVRKSVGYDASLPIHSPPHVKISHRIRASSILGSKPTWFLGTLSLIAVLTGTLPAAATQISGLESPQSFLADPATNSYFISNVNGDPGVRDNNGFITKLNGNAEIIGFKFIQGGQDNTTLHAPKGMALIDNTLYVADVDTLRAFDKNTGHSITNVTFSAQTSTIPMSLVDIAVGSRGLLYVSDLTGNTIYQVDTGHQHRVSVLVHDIRLAGPSGIAVHPKTGHVISVSWEKGSIMDITPEGEVAELVSNSFFTSRFQNLSGVDFDRWGNMYVSDLTAGKVWRMQPNKKFQVIAEYLPSPADIAVDRVNNLILVPFLQANVAEVNGLEMPVGMRGDSKKRTLADYGFVAPPKTDAGAAAPK
jgi:hypothetical protein